MERYVFWVEEDSFAHQVFLYAGWWEASRICLDGVWLIKMVNHQPATV